MRTKIQKNRTKRTYQRIRCHPNKRSCRPHIISSTWSSNQNTGPVIDTTCLNFAYMVGKESGSHEENKSYVIMVRFRGGWCHSPELVGKGGREAECGIDDKEVDTREVAVDE